MACTEAYLHETTPLPDSVVHPAQSQSDMWGRRRGVPSAAIHPQACAPCAYTKVSGRDGLPVSLHHARAPGVKQVMRWRLVRVAPQVRPLSSCLAAATCRTRKD